MNPRTRRWSRADDRSSTGADGAKLPPIREPLEILGAVTTSRSAGDGPPGRDASSRRRRRLPGFGARLRRVPARPRLGRDRHVVHPDAHRRSSRCSIPKSATSRPSKVIGVPSSCLRRGGDACARAHHALNEKALGYHEMTTRAAAVRRQGRDGLFFMPYLTGERLGAPSWQHTHAILRPREPPTAFPLCRRAILEGHHLCRGASSEDHQAPHQTTSSNG